MKDGDTYQGGNLLSLDDNFHDPFKGAKIRNPAYCNTARNYTNDTPYRRQLVPTNGVWSEEKYCT
jgi:hypothetical protein